MSKNHDYYFLFVCLYLKCKPFVRHSELRLHNMGEFMFSFTICSFDVHKGLSYMYACIPKVDQDHQWRQVACVQRPLQGLNMWPPSGRLVSSATGPPWNILVDLLWTSFLLILMLAMPLPVLRPPLRNLNRQLSLRPDRQLKLLFFLKFLLGNIFHMLGKTPTP